MDCPLKGKNAREQALLARAYSTLMGNLYPKDGYPWSPNRLFSPGRPRFLGVWNWDTAFHSVGVSRWDLPLAREGILGFLKFQGENGILPDVIFEDGRVVDTYSKPPVFGWAAEVIYKKEPDRGFLEEIYPKLVKNERWWRENRWENGLFFYDAADRNEPLYERHIRYESGWDNSVRWDASVRDQWPIDLNCFMILFYRALGFFAKELGLPAVEWAAREREVTDLVNARLWNGAYYADARRSDGAVSSVLTPASFMPLFAGIASRAQAEKMAALAADPQKFNGHMPTVTYDDPAYELEYWRGPVWLNVAYFAAKGLKNYGFSVADTIRENILTMVEAEKRGIFENYDSRTNRGLDKKNRIQCNNFSWSSVFVIEFIVGWNE